MLLFFLEIKVKCGARFETRLLSILFTIIKSRQLLVTLYRLTHENVSNQQHSASENERIALKLPRLLICSGFVPILLYDQ